LGVEKGLRMLGADFSLQVAVLVGEKNMFFSGSFCTVKLHQHLRWHFHGGENDTFGWC